MNQRPPLLSDLNELATQLGFNQCEWIPYDRPISGAILAAFIDSKKNAEMKWMQDSLNVRQNPKTLWPWLKSSIVMTFPYFPENKETQFPIQKLRIASYAKNTDYHFWIKEKLETIIEKLQSTYPHETFLSAVDSLPILERDLAYQAGLGWFGKNTCLIHPKKGSLFFICEILTSLEVNNEIAPVPDFCGTCQKCIDICPTNALTEKSLDANRCISYWTIESRITPPTDLAKNFGDWFFGCDLCQTICPWNQKVFKKQFRVQENLTQQISNLNSRIVSDHPDVEQQALIDELKFFLTATGKQIQKKIHGTPLMRAGPFGLRKNSLIVVANLKLKEARDYVIPYLENEKLGNLARWCLKQIETD